MKNGQGVSIEQNELGRVVDAPPLQQSEERFRLMVDSIPGFVCTLNAAGDVEHLNRQVLKYFGKTNEELKNWAMSDAVHPDDLPRVIDVWRQAVENGEPYGMELRHRRADGVYRWFQSNALPARDTKGRVTGWYMLLTDIDDRKRAEDALRSNEENLRLIVDSIPGYVSTANAAGELELINRQSLEYFGKTAEELKNWAGSETVHPDDLPRVIDVWRRAVETGQTIEFEHRARRADGVYRWHQLRGVPDRDVEGRIVHWYILVTDIDERKRAEEAVRRSEAYLTEAQHLSRTGSFGCNVSSGEMFWSDETFRIFGYDGATKPAVEAILERAHPEDKTMVQEQIHRATREGRDCDLEYRLLLPDDSVKHVHVVAHASKDGPDGFEFVGAVMDVTAAKEAAERIRKDERALATTIETIPAHVLSFLPDGTVDFVSHRWLDYVGLSREEMLPTRKPLSPTLGGAWKSTNHPDDLDRALNKWHAALATGEPLELETRYRRADGQYRWFLVRSVPLRDEIGKIVKWYATYTDIDDRKQAEEKLRSNEENLRLIVDSIPGFVSTRNAAGEIELVNRQVLEYFGKSFEEFKKWATNDVLHPDDLPRMIDAWRRSIETGEPIDLEHRSRGADGVHRWFHTRGRPQRDAEGRIVRWYNLVTDIDERKKAEEELRRSKAYLTEAQRLSQTGSFGCTLSTGEMFWSDETFRIYGYDRSTQPSVEHVLQRVHPEDRALVQERIEQASQDGKDCQVECRLLMPDGSIKHVNIVAHASEDESSSIEFIGAVMDVTAERQASAELAKAFDEIAKSEAELRTIIDVIPRLMVTIGADGNFLYANQALLEYTGLTKEDFTEKNFGEVFHQEDTDRLHDQRDAAISRGVPFEYERRVRHKDGQYRWFLIQYNPLLDEDGKVIRWYATGTDIDYRKNAEERTQQENVALREQIDQAFMFEEIVGSSPALKTVLSSIVKVAPTDSTVLITGETGTGKELVARAIHKGSQRAGHAFISVNCSAIPSSLIASELFGHEKGAFTGAMQRRQGRFELAHSGTLFLDEIGELPSETQIALLRVIQERQFERVGGSQVISTDVRIIAATNSDLPAAVAAGTFRADLFYRLNVFPIDVPPLRERKEDIPMLVEYFVKRYAYKARKHFTKIDKNTLKLCQSYDWPGNIRELQNIIERSVILCTGDTFWIDLGWLSSPNAPRLESSGPLKQNLQNYEKDLIEAALAESNGKVAGPNGAAAKLGIPRSTLDLKIKQLNIKKHTMQ